MANILRYGALNRREFVLDIYNFLLGAFLVFSPWIFHLTQSRVDDDIWISGGLVIVVSLAAIVAFSTWEEWVNMLVGLWIAASPWILGFQHTRAMWLNIFVGGMIAYLAALDLWLTRYDSPSK